MVISGGSVSPGEEPAEVMRRLLNDSPLNLYFISLCGGANDALNGPGLGLIYHAAGNYAALQQALSAVLDDTPASTAENHLAPLAVE